MIYFIIFFSSLFLILFIHFSSEMGAIVVMNLSGSYQLANSVFSTLVFVPPVQFVIASVRRFSVRNCLHINEIYMHANWML